MLHIMREDIRVIFERDPAAKGYLEVILAYPGLHALWFQRVAHRLYGWRLYTLARLLSHLARFLTGIEIHPGARIGRRFFIDHGMGVVIGETTEVGHDVTLYQGVTLGGTGKEMEKRHPTLDDGVIVGVGAKVLGSITVGRNSRIGAGAVVVKNVPPNCTVVGIPGRVVVRDGRRVGGFDLNHGDLPDPVYEALTAMRDEIERLSQRMAEMQHAHLRAGSEATVDACAAGPRSEQ
ncbi:MAG: serine O-acetyltransferase [Thermaerobacterales bacterium]